MTDSTPKGKFHNLELQVARAKEGDREALEVVVNAVQDCVYGLAMRFFWHPQDAEDATQEILVRVVTGLGGFRGESGFRTWVYRVACNHLLTLRKKRMEIQQWSFDELGEDLLHGMTGESLLDKYNVDEELLLEEVKIGCTLAMLLCLDRNMRLAYILGEIIELEHKEAAAVLDISPTAYRKRLSRARAEIVSFMTPRCGLLNPENPCRCRKRVDTAVTLGRIDPSNLMFASSLERARRFPLVLVEIRRLDESRRAAALFRSQADAAAPDSIVSWLKKLVVDLDEWSPGPSTT